jgi:hypothetical protein
LGSIASVTQFVEACLIGGQRLCTAGGRELAFPLQA